MTSTASLADAVRACAPHADAEEVAEILAEECIGSPLDVLDAVGHLLGGDDDAPETQAVAEAIYAAIRGLCHKRPRYSPSQNAGGGLASLEWKREYMSTKARFEEPYVHTLGQGDEATLVLQQAPFCPEGFASTVWDSSIVLARYLERHASRYAGKRTIELGSGCGLPSLVLHALGAEATLTDLEENLPLLEANAHANRDKRTPGGSSSSSTCESAAGRPVSRVPPVKALRWEHPAVLPAHLGGPFDVILATDVLYVHEAVTPLVSTLAALAAERAPPAEVLLAAGRNRHAGETFFAEASVPFVVEELPSSELDPTYQCEDVSVWRLRLRSPTSSSTAAKQAAATMSASSASAETQVRAKLCKE